MEETTFPTSPLISAEHQREIPRRWRYLPEIFVVSERLEFDTIMEVLIKKCSLLRRNDDDGRDAESKATGTGFSDWPSNLRQFSTIGTSVS